MWWGEQQIPFGNDRKKAKAKAKAKAGARRKERTVRGAFQGRRGGSMRLRGWVGGLAAILMSVPLGAAALETLHSPCSIAAGEKAGKFRLNIGDEGCSGDKHCWNFSNDEMADRLSGINLADLARDGAQLNAMLSAEAGTFSCAGTVHDGALRGQSTFTPNEAFVERMRQLGFSGFDSEKLQAYTLFDIKTAWVESLQKAKVNGITADNIIALKIFRVDAGYVSALTSLGYETPDADTLVGLKLQAVNAEEVREIRALGYQPTMDELMQIRIFHITPDFIRKMQGRGFKDLTIAKLVQIKIFKMDE